jgi:beta-N-acetylhexosaminidase
MVADSTSILAGQTLIAGFPAGQLPELLRDAAARGELGGFVLFRRNLGTPEEVLEQNGELWATCKPTHPPMIALDQEGGRVSRLGPPVLQLPPMRVLGPLDASRLAIAFLGELVHPGDAPHVA